MTSLSTESPPPVRNPDQTPNRRKGRRSTREKIEKLVADGAKNYPAYLKLIYTGDSEHSSEEENGVETTKGDGGGTEGTVGGRSAVGDGCVEGRGGIVSPESVKLLDPGKEKATTPIGGAGDGVEVDGVNGEKEDCADVAERDERCVCGDAKEFDESSEHVESQQSIEEKWKIELFQLQDDIVSLKAMLNGKLQVASELKQRLGIGPMAELKHDIKHSLQSLKESGTFVKTNAVLRSLSAYASRKMGTIRNSVVFKSVEEKVGRVKSKSMGHLKSKLHRKLPASKSDSHVGQLEATGVHLAIVIDSIEDLHETDSLTMTSSPSKSLSTEVLEE